MEENQIAIPFNAELLKEEPLTKIYRKFRSLIKKILLRLIDIIFAVVGIVFLLPITILVFVGNCRNGKFISPLKSERRITKSGKVFKMYKFNSVKGSEQEKFLDKTSIDELPQIINILLGDMAIVGPRPYLPEEVEKMGTYYKYISRIKPGLTGVYQISGRVKLDFLDRLDMDTRYYYNKSFWTDFKIFLITLFITAKKKEVGRFADYTYTTIKEFLGACIKRIIDIVGALVGIAILLPLTVIVWIINLFSGDKGPLFYSQERIGRFGKHFKIYKFRSMVVGADEKLAKLLEDDPEARKEYKKYKKLKNDPRITKVGNFLRKTSLDEFPQFINVLKGEMSLVGPRPYLPREREEMEEYYQYIIQTKPGVTGLWQVSGRSEVKFINRLEIDFKYYKTQSISEDARIVIKTCINVLGKKGAV